MQLLVQFVGERRDGSFSDSPSRRPGQSEEALPLIFPLFVLLPELRTSITARLPFLIVCMSVSLDQQSKPPQIPTLQIPGN